MAVLSTHQWLTDGYESDYLGFSQASIEHIVGRVDHYRISGPFGSPNYYAQFLVLLIPLGIHLSFVEKRAPLRIATALATTAIVWATFLTFSRGAFLSLIGVAGIALFAYRPRPARLMLILALVVSLLLALPPTYSQRLQALAEGLLAGDPHAEASLRGRTSEAIAAWRMFLEHPIGGVGFDGYSAHYQDYSREIGLDPRREPREPHSLFLGVAAETGLVGLSAFSLVLLVTFRELFGARNRFASHGLTFEQRATEGLLLGLVGFLLAGLFLHLAFARGFWVVVGMAFASAAVARGLDEPVTRNVTPSQ